MSRNLKFMRGANMYRIIFIIFAFTFIADTAFAADCVGCHEKTTPGAFPDWKLSKHFAAEVGCESCHGDRHSTVGDAEKALTVTAQTCANCQPDRYEEYKAGKHAFAWAAMNAMPTTHYRPMELIKGQKGCGGCHKIGLKSEEEVADLKATGTTFGHASCDSCHTRHTFSVAEASEPEACASCHMGFDHPQWEMYSTSKHGIRHSLKRDGILPETAAVPTCQDCHMYGGNHEVRTAWGFLGVRTHGLVPYPGESEQWWVDRVTILQALGVLDPEGNPTARLDVVSNAQVARLSAEDFDKERAKMIKACGQCHSEKFAREEMAKGDSLIEQTDHLMAEAIRLVAGLYKDGLLQKPDNYAYPFPDLLTFHDAPTPIENRLFTMHLKHRMRAFQGAFHMNPDYTLWYGWNEMVQDLDEIRAMAKEMRAHHASE
jgi:hypothetical protein